MAKKKLWSECLTDEWTTLRTLCKKYNLTKMQGLEYMEKKTLILPQTSYNTVLLSLRTMLLHYDVLEQSLHLYFMDKELRDFLSLNELMNFDELKSFIKDNGYFYPVSDSDDKIQSNIIAFPFCIHIRHEKKGYAFNCQLVGQSFNLISIHNKGFMLNEGEYRKMSKIPEEKQNDEYKSLIRLYRLAFNTIAYINCFKDYIKDGVPDIEIDSPTTQKSLIVTTSKEMRGEIQRELRNPSIRLPYFKRGHFMYLKNERYTNKRGEFVWRKPCIVKGRAKTVYTADSLLDDNNKTYD